MNRVEHNDPRERLLMLYGVWVKCLPHQDGKRRLVERCIASCKSSIRERGLIRMRADAEAIADKLDLALAHQREMNRRRT